MQLSPSSSAALEVVNQLGHLGNFASMLLFFQGIQDFLRDGGVACCDGLQARVHFWLSAGSSISKVSIKDSSNLLNLARLFDHKLPLTTHHSYTTHMSFMLDMCSGGFRRFIGEGAHRHISHAFLLHAAGSGAA